MIYNEPLVKPCGDKAFRVTFGEERTLQVNRIVQKMDLLLKSHCESGVLEAVPTYASLTVVYEPGVINSETLKSMLARIARKAMEPGVVHSQTKMLRIPVCYEEDLAPDLDYVCEHTGLRRDEVIHTHTMEPYYTFQLGFTPGCPFLGPLQEKLHVPLMQSPRLNTPEGAIAISIGQTVIYPRATPGGMRVIGRTPVRIFDLDHPDLTLFKPGYKAQFTAISKQKFDEIKISAKHLYEGVTVAHDSRD